MCWQFSVQCVCMLPSSLMAAEPPLPALSLSLAGNAPLGGSLPLSHLSGSQEAARDPGGGGGGGERKETGQVWNDVMSPLSRVPGPLLTCL